MPREDLVKQVHFKAARLVKCLKCDTLFIGAQCPKCGALEAAKTDKLDYREFLSRTVGKTSCGDMSEAELERVNKALNDAGWIEFSRREKRLYEESKMKTRCYIEAQAKEFFRGVWKLRLDGFCERVIGKPFKALDQKELRRVISWVNALKKQAKKRQQEADNLSNKEASNEA